MVGDKKTMLTIVIFLLCGCLLSIFLTSFNRPSYMGDLLYKGMVFEILALILGFFVALMLPMDVYNKHSSLNIEALQDNNSVDGKFLLGCGQIGGKMKYVFYYEENGFYKMGQLDYDLVRIKYTNDKPKVNIIHTYPSNSLINYFAYDTDILNKTYIIEVPRGTIKNNYNLDGL